MPGTGLLVSSLKVFQMILVDFAGVYQVTL